ncbi:MAG TPA: VOC family protein [Bacillales bacterium]|nr:VOC family protein [Bacillales bacterium]
MSKPQISKIATVEIPVSDLDRSVKWYTEKLNLHLDFKGDQNAMLLFNKKGTPSIFLVETHEESRLSFLNSNTGVTHSVIDFYTEDLKGFYEYLKGQDVEVGSYNADPDDPNGFGGFGFKDPDGNWLSACNVDHDKSIPE